MAKWIEDPQAREEVEHVTEELKLPIYKASTKGKFRPWLKECWNKIEDYALFLKKETIDLKATDTNIKENRWRLYSKKLANGTDLNTVQELGRYYSNSSDNSFPNKPTNGNTAFMLIVESATPEVTNKYLVQTFKNFANNAIFRRVMVDYVWKDWELVGDNLDKKLDKTGGTVTGDIHMQGSIFSKNNQKIIGSYNYGFSLYDANWIPKYLAYITTDGKISLGYGQDGLDIDVKSKLTVKGKEVYHVQNVPDSIKDYDDLTTDGFWLMGGSADTAMKNEPYNDLALVHVWRYSNYVYQSAVSYYNEAHQFTRCFQITEKNKKWEKMLNSKNLSVNWDEISNKPSLVPRHGGDNFAGFHYYGGSMYYYIDNSTYRKLWDDGNFNLKKVWSGSYRGQSAVCTLPSDWKVVFVQGSWGADYSGGVATCILFRDGGFYFADSAKEFFFSVDSAHRIQWNSNSTEGSDSVCKAVYVMTGVSL